MSHTTARRRVERVRLHEGQTVRSARADLLAVEEPLQVLVNGEPYATTMRTPGHDLDLALGFLVSEGVIADPQDVAQAEHCSGTSRLTAPDGQPSQPAAGATVASRAVTGVTVAGAIADSGPAADYNAVTVNLTPGVDAPEPAKHRHVTSACGICGTETIDAIRTRSRYDLTKDQSTVTAERIAHFPDQMRSAQRVFEKTGGLHAAGLFGPDGSLLCLREDVGRHNAVDKVVGWAFTRGLLPLTGHVLQVSGRASFELVQKAVLAGIPILAAVSAPSSLAADLADDAGLTLVGFSRGDHFTVYTVSDRIEDQRSMK